MRATLIRTLAASILVLTATIGGMGVFGMHAPEAYEEPVSAPHAAHADMANMGMPAADATDCDDCGHVPSTSPETSCIDHCLALTRSTVPPSAQQAAFYALLCMVVLAFAAQHTEAGQRTGARTHRAREGIAIRHRHAALATVILRN